jgi:hypothetical protein
MLIFSPDYRMILFDLSIFNERSLNFTVTNEEGARIGTFQLNSVLSGFKKKIKNAN